VSKFFITFSSPPPPPSLSQYKEQSLSNTQMASATILELGHSTPRAGGEGESFPQREVKVAPTPDFFNDPINKAEIKEADVRYSAAAKDVEAFDFFTKNTVPTSRSPYTPGVFMCRGAAYFPKFKEYIEKGGIARYIIGYVYLPTCECFANMIKTLSYTKCFLLFMHMYMLIICGYFQQNISCYGFYLYLCRFKNSVVASIRVNSFHSLDEMNGSFQGVSIIIIILSLLYIFCI
jgi:hypothetical protein